MTYNVFGGTLSLSQSVCGCIRPTHLPFPAGLYLFGNRILWNMPVINCYQSLVSYRTRVDRPVKVLEFETRDLFPGKTLR